MTKFIDLSGKRFGRLTVLKVFGHAPDRKLIWECVCDCGKITHRRRSTLRDNEKNGRIASCGCYQVEIIKRVAPPKTHGLSHSPIHRCWKAMMQRCSNPKHSHYLHYGGRGIAVCERWKKFENFAEDMGPRPSLEYSIERINNDIGYTPENCKWGTKQEQALNRRNTRMLAVNGVVKPLKLWADELGLNYQTVSSRIRKYNYQPEQALQ